jgi:hypothetical protein
MSFAIACIGRRFSMRIQETDRILKESRYSRRAHHEEERPNMLVRAWHALESLPSRLFHRK